jgi:uncharacterized membrane protein
MKQRDKVPQGLADGDAASGKANMVQSLSNAMIRHIEVFCACCLTGF